MNTENQTENTAQESVLHDQMSEIRAIEMEGYEIGVRKARNTLFVVAGLFLFWEIVELFRAGATLGDIEPLGWVLLIGLVGGFVALGFFTKNRPYLAILIGLALFILHWVLAVIANGAKGIFGGIIVKAIILFYLINSLQDAKKLEAARKEEL